MSRDISCLEILIVCVIIVLLVTFPLTSLRCSIISLIMLELNEEWKKIVDSPLFTPLAPKHTVLKKTTLLNETCCPIFRFKGEHDQGRYYHLLKIINMFFFCKHWKFFKYWSSTASCNLCIVVDNEYRMTFH